MAMHRAARLHRRLCTGLVQVALRNVDGTVSGIHGNLAWGDRWEFIASRKRASGVDFVHGMRAYLCGSSAVDTGIRIRLLVLDNHRLMHGNGLMDRSGLVGHDRLGSRDVILGLNHLSAGSRLVRDAHDTAQLSQEVKAGAGAGFGLRSSGRLRVGKDITDRVITSGLGCGLGGLVRFLSFQESAGISQNREVGKSGFGLRSRLLLRLGLLCLRWHLADNRSSFQLLDGSAQGLASKFFVRTDVFGDINVILLDLFKLAEASH
jgi:hypothetical protein